MPTYTVHEPSPRKTESVTSPERFVFVRDGFHFWAFLLAPLWLLWRRLWLAFFIYVVATIALGVSMSIAGVPGALRILAEVAIALIIGFEAASIQRWTLSRRGWKALGFVVADDSETAERRFYAAWAERAPEQARDTVPTATPLYAAPVRRGPPSSSDVIGLFPAPGSPR